MKYIDAERLRKEVKGLERAAHKSALGCADSETRKFHEGKDFAYQNVGILIDSLQQEQPDFPTTDEEIEMLLATHPKVEVPNKYKTPDWLWKKQEQPEMELEQEIDTFFEGWTDSPDYSQAINAEGECVSTDEIIEIARQFFNLGLNARREE